MPPENVSWAMLSLRMLPGRRNLKTISPIPKPTISCAVSPTSSTIWNPLSRLAVLTEGQLLSKREPKRKASKKTGSTNRQKLNSFTDLTPGDLVVHENYGIGRFVAMEQIKVDNAIKDYIKIAYQGSDTLFVPATQLDMVSKYIGNGGEDATVKLNKIGSDARSEEAHV